MRLEVGSIHVRDVEVGRTTALSDHTLVIDPEELRARSGRGADAVRADDERGARVHAQHGAFSAGL